MFVPNQSDWRHEKSMPHKLMVGLLQGGGILVGIGLVLMILISTILWDESQRHDELLATTPLRAEPEPIYEIQLNEQAHSILVRTRGNVRLCDSRTGILIREFPQLDWLRTKCMAWLPGSHRFLVGCLNGRLMIMDSRYSHEVVFSKKAHEEEIRSVAVTADGTMAATASKDSICLWDLNQQQLIKQIPAQGTAPKALQFSPDRTQLLIGCDNGSLKLVGTDDFNLKLQIHPSFNSILKVMFIEQGQKIVWGDSGGEIFICEATTGDICWRPPYRNAVLSIAISPNERFMALSDYKVIHVYSLETLEKIRSLEGHTRGITSVHFSDDEPWLYSAGWDGTVRIWDTQAFTELACFQGSNSGPDDRGLGEQLFDGI